MVKLTMKWPTNETWERTSRFCRARKIARSNFTVKRHLIYKKFVGGLRGQTHEEAATNERTSMVTHIQRKIRRGEEDSAAVKPTRATSMAEVRFARVEQTRYQIRTRSTYAFSAYAPLRSSIDGSLAGTFSHFAPPSDSGPFSYTLSARPLPSPHRRK